MTDKHDRLREPPADRLATPFASFDLRAAAEELWREQGASGHGHRQKVLARHGGATVALFVFDRGASLAPHTADGTVVIQCIDGALEVSVDGHPQHLASTNVLVMAPRTLHAVRALERTVMLLTVALHSDRLGT